MCFTYYASVFSKYYKVSKLISLNTAEERIPIIPCEHFIKNICLPLPHDASVKV